MTGLVAMKAKWWTSACVLLLLFDAGFIVYLLATARGENVAAFYTVLGLFAATLFAAALVILFVRISFIPKISAIKNITANFKRGHYLVYGQDEAKTNILSQIIQNLVITGKNINDYINTQQQEMDGFYGMYDKLVMDTMAGVVILDENEGILYANRNFLQYFKLENEYIRGYNINSFFHSTNQEFRKKIDWIKSGGNYVENMQIQIVSLNKVKITANVKIFPIAFNGKRHMVFVFENIHSEVSASYDAPAIKSITESLRDGGIERQVFSTLMTGITSGKGLGFNRVMLFLFNEKENVLAGRMAIGPNSYEEAIKIWSSLTGGEQAGAGTGIVESKPPENSEFVRRVLNASFPMDEDSLFVRAFKKNKPVHIYNSAEDPTVDSAVRQLMDVREFVAVPISIMNRNIGVIAADNKFNNAPISEYNITLLEMFATQAALSLESYDNLTAIEKEVDRLVNRQDAIVESEKLAAIGRIAAHIAHEIRNPLVTMGGHSRRISKDAARLTRAPADLTARIAKASEIILEESERLEKILANVMDFTRPFRYIKELNDINDVVDGTVNLFKNLLLERQVSISIEKTENLPKVKMDFNQMKQVMLNLIQNSIDAMTDGGSLFVRTWLENSAVCISIGDTGAGFAESDIPRLFEPFFTTKVSGIGLGLANVKKIIVDHGGSIKASPRPGGGALFEIKMPVS